MGGIGEAILVQSKVAAKSIDRLMAPPWNSAVEVAVRSHEKSLPRQTLDHRVMRRPAADAVDGKTVSVCPSARQHEMCSLNSERRYQWYMYLEVSSLARK